MNSLPRARYWFPLLLLAVALGVADGQAQDARTLGVLPADPPSDDAFVIKLHDYVPSGASWMETGFNLTGTLIEIDHRCDVSNLPTISYFDDEKSLTGMSPGNYEVRWTVEYVYAGASAFRTQTLSFSVPVTHPVGFPVPGLHPLGWLALMVVLAGVLALFLRRRRALPSMTPIQ